MAMACIFASNTTANVPVWTSFGNDVRRKLLRGPPKCCRWPSLKKKLARQITAVGSNPARPKPIARKNAMKKTLIRHIAAAGSRPRSFKPFARRNPSFAVHDADAEAETVDVTYDWDPPVGRRFALAFMSVFCAQNYVPVARGSASKRVRLKDVENPKLQDALRAAVAGDLENAEKLFSELIAEDPENASVWSNRGSVRLSMNNFDGATRDLSEAIKLAPEAPVPFLNRAIAYEALGRYRDAIEDCKSAIVNDPEEFAAWYNLGNVDLRVQDYDGALVAYERASALAPGIAGYRLKQALVLFQLHRPEEARKMTERLVRKYPNYAEAHAALAAILWSEDRRSGAEDQFTEATVREPLYREIGWVNAELQWPPSMKQAMENFLSIK